MKYCAIAKVHGTKSEIFSISSDSVDGAVWAFHVLASLWLTSQSWREKETTSIELFRIDKEGERFDDRDGQWSKTKIAEYSLNISREAS